NFGVVDAEGKPLRLREGEQARQVIADAFRRAMKETAGVDMEGWSDSELIDGLEYLIFPNLMPWGNMTVPVTYRFLPHQDPDHSLMEVYWLMPTSPGAPKQAPVHRRLDEDQDWTAATELGALGTILDQDTVNLVRLQAGMKASVQGTLRFSLYQESRIRHYHTRLGELLGED